MDISVLVPLLLDLPENEAPLYEFGNILRNESNSFLIHSLRNLVRCENIHPLTKATFTLTGFERFGKILQLPTTVFMNLEELGKTWNVLEFMGKIPQ